MADLPQPIDIKTANDYILINRAIRSRLKTWAIIEIDKRKSLMNAALPNIPADKDGYIKAEHFINDLSNTFVFRKEDFDRFFVGDSDPSEPHQDLKFTHCMIMIGALKQDETDATGKVVKQRGEPTVMIAGCTPLKSDPSKYIITADGTPTGPQLKNIATEHPPKGFKTTITSPDFAALKLAGKQRGKKYLLVEEIKNEESESQATE
jgi:hypothetical protein